MTYYGGKEMAASFRTVRNNTILIAEEIPEDRYDTAIGPGCRTVAQTIAHIAFIPDIQMNMQKEKVTDLKTVNFAQLLQAQGADESKPRSKSELIALLRSKGEEFATYLEGLSETFLSESVAMPPGAAPTHKSRLEMLLAPKEHEMHHRGQLMVSQRAFGLTPHLTRERAKMFAQAAQAARA
jgi:uncharacterized damage-inducible protein DinB